MDNSQGKQSLTVSRYCFGTGPATFNTSKQPMQNGVVSLLTNPKSHRKLKVAGGSAMKGIKYILAILAIGFLSLGLLGCELPTVYESEPNNSMQNADEILFSIHKGEIYGVGDMDYWVLNVPGDGATHTFTLSNMFTDLQLMLYVCDFWDTIIDSADLGGRANPSSNFQTGTTNEQITFSTSTARRLFLLVQESGDTSLVNETGPYWLSHDVD